MNKRKLFGSLSASVLGLLSFTGPVFAKGNYPKEEWENEIVNNSRHIV